MLDKSVFDPDVQERVAENMTPREFGIQVARIFQETPSSSNQAVAGQAIQAVTGWTPDWEQAERLIERVSQAEIPSPSAAEAAGEQAHAPIDDSQRLRNTVLYALRSLLEGPRRGALESTENTNIFSAKELEALISACDPDEPVDMQCVVSGGLVRSFGASHPLAYLLEGVMVIDFDDDNDPDGDAYAWPIDGRDVPRSCRPVFRSIEPSEIYRIELVDERETA